MSSILKALKKIEGRKVDTSLPIWPFGSGSLESMDRHIHRSRQRQKILGLLILLCAVALAGKLYIGSRSDSDSTPAQNTPSPVTVQSEKPAESAAPEARKTIAIMPQSTLEPEPLSQEPPPETEALPVISPPQEEPSEVTTVTEAPPTVVTENFGTPPADNAGLSLMALVWSPRPESRFVVINGTIVRENGSIEASTVVSIEEDYAVMRTDGITWKLK